MLTNGVAAGTSRMLRHGLTYVRCFGIVTCRLEVAEGPKAKAAPSRAAGLVARESYWWRRLCIAFRFIWIVFYTATFSHLDVVEGNEFVSLLRSVKAFSCFVSSFALLTLQLWYNKRALIVLNKFLRLSRRIRSLDPSVRGFGGVREFTLLLLKVLCCCFELFIEMAYLPQAGSALSLLIDLVEVFMVIALLMLLHIGFVGFLCVGAFYAEINSYVQRNLRRQLRTLNTEARENYSEACSPRRLKATAQQMHECIGIYNEIQKVGREFERLIELPLCLALLFNVSALALFWYFTFMSKLFANVGRWLFVLKIFADIVLLTLAANGAVSSSRVVRRLGLESAYVGEDARWNKNLELFFSRLNFYEYQVRPLGLFELSNQFILCLVSGLVTYLIFIVQSAIQMHEL